MISNEQQPHLRQHACAFLLVYAEQNQLGGRLMTRQVYLDNNATTAVHPEVLEAMLPFFRASFGNPSSVHWAGRAVKSAIEEARDRVAALVNCDPSEVVFTSCATESNN